MSTGRRIAQRLQRPVMGGALQLLVLLAAAAALPRAAAVKGLSGWSTGMITHFGGAQDGMDPSSPSFGTVKGSCGYGLIPKDQYPYFSTAALSRSNPFYLADELHGCGQCFQIQCADSRSGVCKTDSAGEPLSVIVMISDSCPECETHHIDVQSLVFAKMADPGLGKIGMQYRRVECAPPKPMEIAVMDFRGAGGWLRLSITDAGGRAAIKSVAVRGSGTSAWQEMQNSWGATWELARAPSAPLDIKITSDDGEEVVAEDVISKAGGISSSAGATGPRTSFDAGVQFTITDEALGQVQAFDGPADPMLVTSATPGATDGASASASASASGSSSATASSASASGSGSSSATASSASASGSGSSSATASSASASGSGSSSASASASASLFEELEADASAASPSAPSKSDKKGSKPSKEKAGGKKGKGRKPRKLLQRQQF